MALAFESLETGPALWCEQKNMSYLKEIVFMKPNFMGISKESEE